MQLTGKTSHSWHYQTKNGTYPIQVDIYATKWEGMRVFLTDIWALNAEGITLPQMRYSSLEEAIDGAEKQIIQENATPDSRG